MSRLWEYRLVRGVLLLTALWSLFSSLYAYADEDVRRATPPLGKSLIFIFRTEREPIAVSVPVVVNAVRIGELTNGTFLTALVSPGTTYLRIGDRILSTMSLVATTNQSYFVRIRAISGGISLTTDVDQVSEVEGRRSIAQSRFVGAASTVMPPAQNVQQRPAAAPSAQPIHTPPKVPSATQPPAQQPNSAAKPAIRQPSTAPEISPASGSDRKWDIALAANVGTFKLSNSNQMVAGSAFTPEPKSKSVFGVGIEWRNKAANVAVGGEFFSYKNDLTTTVVTPSGLQEVQALMVNGKYYFHATDWLYPFVGAGVGQARAHFSGGWTGSTKGPGYQGMMGLDFRFRQIGLYVQYKYLASTTGSGDQSVKVGGSGIFAGISAVF